MLKFNNCGCGKKESGCGIDTSILFFILVFLILFAD